MKLHIFPAERVLLRLRGGSSSPVVVATSGGQFVAKLRGAGHGVAALVAEIVVAELAETLGLPVPERALIELDADVPSDDRNDELADLLRASVGTNLGFRRLDGAREPRPAELAALDEEFVARVLWLDGLVQNPDRTTQNPNILIWKQRPWLVDHGSALMFHHDWPSLSEESPRQTTDFTRHVFVERLGLVARFDAQLAKLLSREALDAAVAAVPDEFLLAVGPETRSSRNRAAYQAFLWKRLKTPRPFVPALAT